MNASSYGNMLRTVNSYSVSPYDTTTIEDTYDEDPKGNWKNLLNETKSSVRVKFMNAKTAQKIKPDVHKKLAPLSRRNIKDIQGSFKHGFFGDYNARKVLPTKVQQSNVNLIDKQYKTLFKECGANIEEFSKTTPFNRK